MFEEYKEDDLLCVLKSSKHTDKNLQNRAFYAYHQNMQYNITLITANALAGTKISNSFNINIIEETHCFLFNDKLIQLILASYIQ